jgi:hypothetical protein
MYSKSAVSLVVACLKRPLPAAMKAKCAVVEVAQ